MKIFTFILFLLPYIGFSVNIIDEPLTSGSGVAGWTDNNITYATSAGGYAHFTSTDSHITTSTINLSGYTNVMLTFDVAKFGTGGDGPITVEVSNDNGATWTAQTYNSPTPINSTYMTSGPTAITPTGTTVKIRFIRTNSASQKRFRNVLLTGDVALPVKFNQINATNDNNTNTLNWETATEINNSHFEILHSTDARSYVTIGKELGNGNATENVTYSYDHQNVKPGTHYYQLRQVDYDGRSETFGPVSVTVEGSKLKFYPTAAENMIHFEGEMENENYMIYSVDGKTFQSGKVSKQIDIRNIPNGVYYIRYGNETSQLVKM